MGKDAMMYSSCPRGWAEEPGWGSEFENAVTGAHSRDLSCTLMVKCLSGEDRLLNFTLHTVESHRGLLSMEVEVTEVMLLRCQKINCTSQIWGQFFKQSLSLGELPNTSAFWCLCIFLFCLLFWRVQDSALTCSPLWPLYLFLPTF